MIENSIYSHLTLSLYTDMWHVLANELRSALIVHMIENCIYSHVTTVYTDTWTKNPVSLTAIKRVSCITFINAVRLPQSTVSTYFVRLPTYFNIVICFLRYLFFFRLIMAEPRFTIEEEITRQFRRFNAAGTQLTVRLLPPTEWVDSNPMSHFLASVSDLFGHALQNWRFGYGGNYN
jgi:hypothetical protein